MKLGLAARFDVKPSRILADRWTHDMANALCSERLRLERLERESLTDGDCHHC